MARRRRRKSLYIEPGSPWQNGYRDSFNSGPRDEFARTLKTRLVNGNPTHLPE